MSLPTKAVIKNAAGEEIDRQFVNVGYYVTASSLARVFMFQIQDKGFVGTDTIEAYNVIIPVKILRDVADGTELTKRLESFVERAEHKGERNVVVV